MNAIVIEHVKVEELPQAWREKLIRPVGAHVTVRIEEESSAGAESAEEFATDDPAFGIWRDREDMADVAATCANFGRRVSTAMAHATSRSRHGAGRY